MQVKPENRAWILALVLTGVGLWLRTSQVFAYWLQGDEGIYYSIAHAGSFEEWRGLVMANAHPPLYHCVMVLFGLFGESIVWLRVPALLFGTLLIYATFSLARRLGGVLCGLLSAGMIAVAPGTIAMSTVARPYMMHIAVSVLALQFLTRWMADRRGRDLWIYSGLVAVAMLVHYSTFQILGGIGLCLVVLLIAKQIGRRDRLRLVLAHVPVVIAAVVLYAVHIAPRLMGSQIQAEAQVGWLRPLLDANPVQIWKNYLGVFDYLMTVEAHGLASWWTGSQLAGAFGLLFVAGAVLAVVTKRVVLAALAIGLPIVAIAFSVAGLYPFGCSRHSVYLSVVFAPTVAFGFSWLCGRGRVAATVGIVVLAALFALGGALNRALGLADSRPRPAPELYIPMDGIEEFVEVMQRIRATEGVLLMDRSASYVLEPLFTGQKEDVRNGDEASVFRWGRRHVYVNSRWIMACGTDHREDSQHLYRILRDLRRERPTWMNGDVRVASAWGTGQIGQIGKLARPPERETSDLISDGAGGYLIVFRLHVPNYMTEMELRFGKPR